MSNILQKNSVALCLLSAMALCGGSPPANADDFILVGGGKISGELLNPDASPRQQYLVRLHDGGRIALDPAQVVRAVIKTDEEKEYDERLASLPDTLAAHWAMAEWCVEKRLLPQQLFHLEQVIRHDPDHYDARSALGYQQRENGLWMTHEEFSLSLGLVRQGRSWISPQQLAIETEREQIETLEFEWITKLRRWRGWLDTERRHAEGLREIQAIRDPWASRALAEGLADEDEPTRLKIEYIKVLGHLQTGRSVGALIKASLESDEEEIRLLCLDKLEDHGRQAAMVRYIRALKSSDNRRVNRAAIGLSRLGNETAILPLIHALNTKHRFRTGSAGAGSISPTFGSDGSGGLGVGGGPSIVEHEIQNRQVHQALLSLIGRSADHQFNEEAWSQWYARENTPRHVNLRRSN